MPRKHTHTHTHKAQKLIRPALVTDWNKYMHHYHVDEWSVH